MPYRLGDLVPVHLEDRPGVIHAGHEHADEGFPLRAAHGVPHEHHPLPAQPLQRGAGRKLRHVAPVRLPPPLEVASVVPPVAEAVEPALRERALGAVVERVAAGVVAKAVAADDTRGLPGPATPPRAATRDGPPRLLPGVTITLQLPPPPDLPSRGSPRSPNQQQYRADAACSKWPR